LWRNERTFAFRSKRNSAIAWSMALERVDRKTTCPSCGELAFVLAKAQVSPFRRIWAFCPNAPDQDGHRLSDLFIGIDAKMVELFPELGEVSGNRPAWARISTTDRYAILQRDGFRCVFCRRAFETGEHPLSAPQTTRSPSERLFTTPAVFGANAVVETDTAFTERLLFGANADHILPYAYHAEILSNTPAPKHSAMRARLGQQWAVASCPQCDVGRYHAPMSSRTLLEIYARHLFERSGVPDWDDFDAFRVALKQYAYIRRAEPRPLKESGAEAG
jgi:hypothetical protein